jgi:molybdopterin-guanine dinucleotide biosynthesis protein A
MNMRETVDAVVLTSGRIDGEYARAAGTTIKALARAGGRTLVQHGLAALQDAPGVRRICVVGPEEVRPFIDDHLWQPEAGSALENVLAGIEQLAPEEEARVLICGSDLPVVDARSIQDFVDRAPAAADACMPVVKKEAYAALFPGSSCSFVQLAGGAMTGGNQFLLRVSALREHVPLMRELFQQRKSALGMARVLGAPVVWKFVTGRLTMPGLVARLSELTGCHCEAVIDCRPELAFDIDDYFNLRYAEQWWAMHREGAGGHPAPGGSHHAVRHAGGTSDLLYRG